MKSFKVLVACMFLSALICLLSGCVVAEISDMIFDDDCIYRGTVQKVYHGTIDGKTTVTFESGKAITCIEARWVEQGDWIEARKREHPEANYYFSGCEFDR